MKEKNQSKENTTKSCLSMQIDLIAIWKFGMCSLDRHQFSFAAELDSLASVRQTFFFRPSKSINWIHFKFVLTTLSLALDGYKCQHKHCPWTTILCWTVFDLDFSSSFLLFRLYFFFFLFLLRRRRSSIQSHLKNRMSHRMRTMPHMRIRTNYNKHTKLAIGQNSYINIE